MIRIVARLISVAALLALTGCTSVKTSSTHDAKPPISDIAALELIDGPVIQLHSGHTITMHDVFVGQDIQRRLCGVKLRDVTSARTSDGTMCSLSELSEKQNAFFSEVTLKNGKIIKFAGSGAKFSHTIDLVTDGEGPTVFVAIPFESIKEITFRHISVGKSILALLGVAGFFAGIYLIIAIQSLSQI